MVVTSILARNVLCLPLYAHLTIEEIDIIDINMGCPAPKVTKNGDGSALLKDLDKIDEILQVATKVSKKPPSASLFCPLL